MATLNDFEQWLCELRRAGPASMYVEEVSGQGQPEPQRRVRLYTHTNRYAIVATVREDGGYLGCIANCRKPRAGEDWTRGSDLADGTLSQETWHKILADIVSYEMVRVHSIADAHKAAEIQATDQADLKQKYNQI